MTYRLCRNDFSTQRQNDFLCAKMSCPFLPKVGLFFVNLRYFVCKSDVSFLTKMTFVFCIDSLRGTLDIRFASYLKQHIELSEQVHLKIMKTPLPVAPLVTGRVLAMMRRQFRLVGPLLLVFASLGCGLNVFLMTQHPSVSKDSGTYALPTL